MTRKLLASIAGLTFLTGSLALVLAPTVAAQSRTIRPAIVLPPATTPFPEATPDQAPAPAPMPQAARPSVATPGQAVPMPSPSPAPSDLPDAILDANVRIDVTISYQVGTAAAVKRTASLVVANDSSSSSLRAGISLPVPSTTLTPVVAPARGDEKVAANSVPSAMQPLTSFNYRSVGLNVDVNRASIRRTGRVELRGLQVEFSAIDDKTLGTAQMPSFPTFSQRFWLTLENGKPLVVAQSTDVVDGQERKQTVEVRATILPGGDEPRPKR